MTKNSESQNEEISANDLYGSLSIKAANHCLDFMEEAKRRLGEGVCDGTLGDLEVEMRDVAKARSQDKETAEFLEYLVDIIVIDMSAHMQNAAASFIEEMKNDLPLWVQQQFIDTREIALPAWRSAT